MHSLPLFLSLPSESSREMTRAEIWTAGFQSLTPSIVETDKKNAQLIKGEAPTHSHTLTHTHTHIHTSRVAGLKF